jgi:hypothetical protein
MARLRRILVGGILWAAVGGNSAIAQPAGAPRSLEPPATAAEPTRAADSAPAAAPSAPMASASAATPAPAPPADPAPRAAEVVIARSVAEPAAPVTAPPVETPGAPVKDPLARPFFIKGDLSNFVVRPMTRRNFIGVGAGVSAVPNDTNTLLNAFYLTIEPQIDIVNRKYNWRLGLGAPLQFQLIDTRGIFETCIGQGRMARAAGGDQATVMLETGTCVSQQKDHLTQNFGKLRRADWDQPSDFARIIRYAVVGGQEEPFYLNVSRLYDQSFGHGTVVRDYNANLDYNTARLGATLDFNRSALGVQAMANDLVSPDVVGLMFFVRPMRPYSENVFWRSLSVGLSAVHGVNLPRALHYEKGLFFTAFDQPIPQVDSSLKLVGGRYASADIFGGDVEAKVLRTQSADVKVYLDYQRMASYGGGATVGSLARFSAGRPAWRALRARAEVTYFDPDYLPSFFDTYHDIFQYQYLPVAYKASNGLIYHPTKLQYLEANRGERHRVGAYLELQHSFLEYLTVGAVARLWRPVGSAKSGSSGPAFPDYGPACTDLAGELTCQRTISVKDAGFTSLRFSAEIPLRRYLQAFASYEVFSTSAEKGLGVFRFDGDNEIFFSGARLMLLPVFFIQAEARRYFFLQRVHDVDLTNLTLHQDQNYHANWTFALNAFVGYEF